MLGVSQQFCEDSFPSSSTDVSTKVDHHMTRYFPFFSILMHYASCAFVSPFPIFFFVSPIIWSLNLVLGHLLFIIFDAAGGMLFSAVCNPCPYHCIFNFITFPYGVFTFRSSLMPRYLILYIFAF
jgi:hypothetical protein